MTIMMSDLPQDLVEEILSRVPMKSLRAVRSTCKEWNAFSKHRILCKREVSQEEFLAFTLKETRVCSMRFDLNGIQNEDVEFVEPYIEQISEFDQVEIFQVFHCNGLLLLVIKDDYFRLMIWNPYLGQTKWIEPKYKHDLLGAYAFGCDNNNNYKILKFLRGCKIYYLKSNSWRVLDINTSDSFIDVHIETVSLKGYAYFYCQGEKLGQTFGLPPIVEYLVSFDFTKERFGPRLPLPSTCHLPNTLALTSVREEQLAVLFSGCYSFGIEIWITTKIEFDAVSWSKFLSINVTRFDETLSRSFFIDQEKKLALFFFTLDNNNLIHNIAYIGGENGHLRRVNLGDSEISYPRLPVCSYVPSLVQISQGEEPSLIDQKTRSRLLPSLFYSASFVLFIFLFIYFVFFLTKLVKRGLF